MVIFDDDGWGRGFELALGLLGNVVGGIDAVGEFLHAGPPAGCLGLEFALVSCLCGFSCHVELADGGCNFTVVTCLHLIAVTVGELGVALEPLID